MIFHFSSQKIDERKPSMLAENSINCVTVSHVENGAKAFYVQLDCHKNILHRMSSSINQLTLIQPGLLQEGGLYLVKSKNVLYRGLILSTDSDSCQIRLVDYGVSTFAKYPEIYDLPPQFLALGHMAYRFCLSGVLNNPTLCNNPDVTEKFKILTKNTQPLILKVVAPDGPPTLQYCELLLDGRNILDLLIAEATTPLTYGQKLLQIGVKHEVIVSFVETKSKELPWPMFVQLVSDLDKVEQFTTFLGKLCESTVAPDPSRLRENAPVVAKNRVDGKWYRGMLLKKHDSSKSTVYFVDRGNTEEIPMKYLRLPSKRIVESMPAQAHRCFLDGVSSNQAASLILDSKFSKKVCFSSSLVIIS